MESERREGSASRAQSTKGIFTRRRVSVFLLGSGVLLLLAAGGYAGYARLNTWLREQSRYLETHSIAPVPIPTAANTGAPMSAETAVAGPAVVPTPPPDPTHPVEHYPPIQIRIPAINVSRSIVELPATDDPKTGAWTRNTDILFQPGRSDLVGHWEGSAYPGQTGNMILVGHNYGYGYNGVFVRLGRLRAGDEVIVVDEAGQSFTYEVTTSDRLKWQEKDLDKLALHWDYLSPGGAERLTLVTCGGANVEPFPERIYVVAEPVR